MAATKANAPGVEESTYEPGEFIRAASIFKTTPEIMAGALYGVDQPITKAQAEKKLEEFLARPVDQEKGVTE